MNGTPRISVIIPSFDKARYIEKTLSSIFDQDYKNLQVIIQDGGSTDGTLEIIKKYSKKYPTYITWESKRDNGQLEAVNAGFNKATGDIQTFINADDAYVKGAFKALSEALANNPNALWFAGRAKVINGNDQEIAQPVTWYKNFLLSLNSRLYLLITNYMMQPSVFITRSAYKKYGPFTGTADFIMEYDLWLKLGRAQMPIIINKNLSSFRIESSTKTKRMFSKLLTEDEKIVNRFTKNPVILFLHNFHNLGRVLIGRFV